jgi:hypothetical protein
MRNHGPPGVALLPEGHWQRNKSAERKRPTTALLRDKGYFSGEPVEHGESSRRIYLPESRLQGLVDERIRPSTALLAGKGAWNSGAAGRASQSTLLGETGNSGGPQNGTDASVGAGSLDRSA